MPSSQPSPTSRMKGPGASVVAVQASSRDQSERLHELRSTVAGLVNGSALLVSITSALLRLFQNGKLRFYAYVFALGAAAFVLYLALTI